MKRLIALFVILLMITLPVMSQDATVEPTEEAAATEQVIATVTASDFVTPTGTPEPEATAVVIDINVDVTDGTNDAGTGDTGETPPAAGMNPDLVFVGLVVLLLVYGLADKFSNYTLSKKLAEAIPADWQPVIEQGANTARRIVYERAGAFADSTESPIDNNLLDEEMKNAGWEFYIDPTTGNRHARKIVTSPPVASPQG